MGKVRAGLLQKYEIVEEYHGIKPALLLFFTDGTVFPIREHRFLEYFELIAYFGQDNQ